MWARIAELIIALWLLGSRFFLPYGILQMNWTDFAVPLAIILFAALSFIGCLNKMHLLQVLPAGWLLYVSYSYPTPLLPFGLQNHILTALFLLLFAIIPSNASDHPRPWKRYYSKER